MGEESSKQQKSTEDCFIISEELQELSADDLDEVYRVLVSHDDGVDTCPPIYRIMWARLAKPFEATPGPAVALTHRVLLYKRLEEFVEQNAPERIVCEGLSAEYRALVADISKAHDIEVAGAISSLWVRIAFGYLRAIPFMILLLIDQIFSLLWYRDCETPEQSETVFVPHLQRFDSIEPVIRELESSSQLLALRPTLDRIRSQIFDRREDVEQYNPVAIHQFVNLSVIWSQIKMLLLTFPREVFVERRNERFVNELLWDEFGVKMPYTVSHAFGGIYQHASVVMYLAPAKRAFEVMNPDNVVFGSTGPKQLGVLSVARESGIATHHVPHTVTMGYEVVPSPETTHIVPGQVAINHLADSKQVTSLDNIEPLGRPYFEQIPHPEDAEKPVDTPFTITILTQPRDDEIRRALVTDIIEASYTCAIDTEFVVKIHPLESSNFYQNLDVIESVEATVETGALFETLSNSDLAFVVNSNTGLESMLIGTPIAVVNQWSPVVRTRPYAANGPVPVLTSLEEIEKFFSEFSREVLQQMRTEQLEYVNKNYRYQGSTAARIAQYLHEAASE